MFYFWNLCLFMWLWCFWSGIFTPSWMLWMKSYVWNHVYVDFFIWLGLIYSYWWKTTWVKKKRRKKEEEENKIIPQTEESPFMNWTLKWYKIIWTESGRNLESERALTYCTNFDVLFFEYSTLPFLLTMFSVICSVFVCVFHNQCPFLFL